MPRILILLALLLSACASQPEPLAPTTVRLQLEATSDLNPSPAGVASPVWIHLYQLRSGSTFSRADFFSLVQQGAATLGGDLVEHDQFVIRPGESLVKSLALDDASRQLGVVVAYRALDRSTWRQLIEIPAHQASAFYLRLDAQALRASALTTP